MVLWLVSLGVVKLRAMPRMLFLPTKLLVINYRQRVVLEDHRGVVTRLHHGKIACPRQQKLDPAESCPQISAKLGALRECRHRECQESVCTFQSVTRSSSEKKNRLCQLIRWPIRAASSAAVPAIAATLGARRRQMPQRSPLLSGA